MIEYEMINNKKHLPPVSSKRLDTKRKQSCFVVISLAERSKRRKLALSTICFLFNAALGDTATLYKMRYSPQWWAGEKWKPLLRQ